MTTLTIKVDIPLKELKEKYRKNCGIPKTEKVTKKQVAGWLGNLAQADVEGDI